MKLTLPQQDIYFEQLLHPEDPIYNIGAKLEVRGKIVYEILNEAYVALIDQHDAYRSVVIKKGDDVEIEIVDEHNSELGFLDFSDKEDPDAYANNYMQRAFIEPYNLLSGTFLHTFLLIKIDDDRYYIFTMYHHILTDGWGTSLMFQRWVKNYNELIESGSVTSEYPFTYRDFVSNDEEYELSEGFETDKNYWAEKFNELPEVLLEKFQKNKNINKSSRKGLYVSRAVYSKLEALAKEHRSSTFHVILAILFMYFGRKTQNSDFAIGLPVLNRGKSIFKKTVGLFMGVSALRIPLDFESTFEELIGQIKQQLRQDYRHQRFPMGKLVKELGLFQQKEGLFNITLSYEKQNYADHFKNTITRVLPLSHQAERVALALYIREFDAQEDVKIDFDYNLNYFNEEMITQVTTHFEELINEVVINAKKPLSHYNYITKAEQRQVINEFNETDFFYPKDMTFLRFLENHIKADPLKVAVKDVTKSYSYQGLGEASDRVANYIHQNLNAHGTAPVAVLMDRSADMIATLLGILKTGRAYIPLDPSFPIDRLNYILAHSEVNCVIGDGQLKELLTNDITYLHNDTLLNFESESVSLEKVTADATAYIIYTSGSTGKPKGVAVGHRSLLNFLMSMQIEPGIRKTDVLFSVTTASFDISILEFFAPLLCGSTLVVATKEQLESAKSIINALEEEKPTLVQATPSFFQMLFNGGWSGDQNLKILCGGDLLSTSLAKKLVSTTKSVWNMYGPTETTIWSSCKQIKHSDEARTIGRPIQNTKLYVLDENLNPLPTGSIGELYIGGDGLSKGYYKSEALTAKSFVDNPFIPGKKIYRTGDLAKWNTDGEMLFLGRADHQVKVRGYRIETGEIETRLNELTIIEDSVVVTKKNEEQGAFLVAFVTTNEAKFKPEVIVQALQRSLPEYMIPYTIIEVESFPLTPNNKVDRKALSNYNITVSNNQQEIKEPVTIMESEVANIYQEVLALADSVSTNANFFTLGGHSLSAVKLVRIIEDKLNYVLTLRDVFDYPTIESLSSYLQLEAKKGVTTIEPTTGRNEYPITSSQYAIWLASQRKEGAISYNMVSSYAVKGEVQIEALEEAFQRVIAKHEILRTRFVEDRGEVFQKVIKDVSDFRIEMKTVQNAVLEKNRKDFASQEFDLTSGKLLKAMILRTNGGEMFLNFATHHIIMDGWSLEVLITELATHYQQIISEENSEDEQLAIQFKDYSVWLKEKQEQQRQRNLAFWKSNLNGYNWNHLIPFDHNVSSNGATGANYKATFDVNLVSGLKQLLRSSNTSLHSLLVASFNCLVHKMNGPLDVCVGTMNSGRNFANAAHQIGMYAKTLPLRNKMASNSRFVHVLDQVHDLLLTIDTHQELPEEVRSTLRLDVLLVLQNQSFSYDGIRLSEDVHLKWSPLESNYNRLPLLLEFSEMDERLEVRVDYDSSKYHSETIQLMIMKYEKLLEQIVANPQVQLMDMDLQLAIEEDLVDISFNF